MNLHNTLVSNAVELLYMGSHLWVIHTLTHIVAVKYALPTDMTECKCSFRTLSSLVNGPTYCQA